MQRFDIDQDNKISFTDFCDSQRRREADEQHYWRQDCQRAMQDNRCVFKACQSLPKLNSPHCFLHHKLSIAEAQKILLNHTKHLDRDLLSNIVN